MIVISGALVLVAAVLLILGIVSSITLVYAAIGLSLVSAVFLLVGVFQRPVPAGETRESEGDTAKRQAPAKEPEREPSLAKKSEPAAAAADQAGEAEQSHDEYETDETADYPLEAQNAEFEAQAAATGADVLVISGRPRYHVGGCEYIEGNDDSEPLDIAEARELGFTPCGVCRPNETLARGAAARQQVDGQAPAASPGAAPAASPAVAAPAAAVPQANGSNSHAAVQEPATPDAAPAAAAAPPLAEPVSQAAAPPPPAPPPVAEPVHSEPVHSEPAQSAPPVMTPATDPITVAPVPMGASPEQAPAAAAPAQPAAEPAPVAEPAASGAAPAASAGRTRRTVQAVAATKTYHRPECELLAGAESQELTKTAAIRQAYLACAVCKP